MKRRYSRPTPGHAFAVVWLIAAALPARADTAGAAPMAADPPATTAAGAPAAPAAMGTPAALVSTDREHVSLELKDVNVEQAAKQLGGVLGGEVHLEGPTNRKVTLNLEEVTVREALDRAAHAMDATWKCTFVFAKVTGLALPPVPRTGLKVSLSLSDASCQTAAIIAAKAAGGRVEGASDLTGRVTLVGKEIPVEDVMSQIARAADATWRPVYTFKLEAPTATPLPDEATKPADAGKPIDRNRKLHDLPVYDRNRGLYIDKNGRRRYHSMPKERRTRYNQLSQYGAKPRTIPPPNVERLEQLSRLGAFAGIFSSDDAKEREQRVQRFCAALEAQAERLAMYQPQHRRFASQLTGDQLRGLLNDVKALDEEQKKEIAPITEIVERRLKDLASDLQPKAPANPGAGRKE